MKDDKKNPLLDQNLKKEFELLDIETSTFNTSIDDINKYLDTKNIDDVNLSSIVKKLQNVKLHMERINDKILYFKNFMKEETGETIVLLNKLMKTSEAVTRKYEVVNKKFSEKIETAKKNIQAEIEERTNIQKEKSGQTGQNLVVMKKMDSKVRMDVDRLKERQGELEQITKISYQLLKLSKDMREECDKQSKIVNSIENHIVISNIKTGEANEQLERRTGTQSFNIKFYLWVCSFLCFFIMFVVGYLYWKYWRVSQNQSGF